MFNIRKNSFFKIIVLMLFFSFLIFITKNYFFWWKEDFQNQLIEEEYIEPIIDKINENQVDYSTINKKVETKILENLNSAEKIKYKFIPENFNLESDFFTYFNVIDSFFVSNLIQKKISNLDIFFYKDKSDVRWKMQNKKLKLFWIYNMTVSELLAVWIHEFWHFYDLYILEKKVSLDISDYFYYISWDWVSAIKAWLEQKDFVSWYAMTNKYEDFAESFTYYILHNSDFYKKSEDSLVLKQKYDYFSRFVFRNDEFKTDNYKITTEIKNYYRDITKVEFSLENLLQYLKK